MIGKHIGIRLKIDVDDNTLIDSDSDSLFYIAKYSGRAGMNLLHDALIVSGGLFTECPVKVIVEPIIIDDPDNEEQPQRMRSTRRHLVYRR